METIYINKGIKNATRRMALGCLLLFASFGSLVAQNDPLFVIKKDGNYLAHVKVEDEWVIQNATEFSPNCLWYSSNNYNYYLLDGDDRMYLKAPLELNGEITIAPNPGTSHLGLTTQDYFFYDWDDGLARGVQEFHEDGSCPSEYNIGDNSECWKAVWVSYENSQWQMSSVYGYDQTTYAADFYPVTVTEHAMVVTPSGESNLGLTSLQVPETMEAGFSGEQISATIENFAYTYIPAYTTYFFDGGTHNYYDGSDHDNTTPSLQSGSSTTSDASYEWTISCEGHYLTFDEGGDPDLTSYDPSPTIYYPHSSTEGRKVATITLTVTYANTGATQTMSEDVVLLVECQNPGIIDAEITYQGVTISWYPTADAFQVMWKINDENVTEWNNSGNLTTTTYTFPGLEYSTSYLYKVKAICTSETGDPTQHDFTTLAEPNLVVAGAIFGGGRMANVTRNTEVVVVNCDYIDAVYGGNDIAGEVQGADGAKITIGVNTDDTNGYDTIYGITDSRIKIGSVYGGGNGYYAYNGTSFVPATENYTSETVEAGASVNAMTQSHTVGDVVWTNKGTNPVTLDFPSIVKTAITVSNDFVNVDSIFGGAKNAFLTYNNYRYAGDSIAINGGTILAVFGGNNFGGDQGYGKHHIEVNGTTTLLVPTNEVSNTVTTGFGRDFGIRYLYGGGNKVYGSTTEVFINGGQCDTIFAGGNAADVYAANLTVNCAIAAGSENTYGQVYSNAIYTYDGSTITPKDDYEWDGISGIYNIRTLFGGNNQADFDSRHNNTVPTITLTSGSIGTVYGGGNAGNMLGLSTDDGHGGVLNINGNTVKYGTHVAMNSANVLVDKLYGGCQVSDVSYSTWVEIKNGHVGYVFGGCNVSGDVGSSRVNMEALENNLDGAYQEVYGGTYVVAQGGTVYKNLFAGGNGYYHCVDVNGFYTDVLSYDDPDNLYVGLLAPTHNETNVVVQTGATVKGNVYAGGNLAYVGFNNNTVGDKPYPKLVGLASVRMSGGEVFGNVYGGGNMADVYGSNEVQVSGGTIHQSLYGGNDRMGKVAQITNRKLPESYNTASDGVTSLLIPKVNTYVSLTNNPHITNVYGGGNGYYEYFTDFDEAEAYDGPKETVVSCDISNQPIQSSTFVDIAIDGGAEGGQIGTVYGGGDGVSVEGSLRVFLNVQGDNPTGYTNVGTIFGGNNKGNLALVSDIILLKGQVGTVYGGCNEGAMQANTSDNLKTIGGYPDIGSYVRLLSGYDGDGSGPAPLVTPEVVVTEAIYGGCRMNGVTRNSLVLVEGGNFSNIPIFGGSDISGHVGDISRVAVVGGIVGNMYGGGNGNYDYEEDGNVYRPGSDHTPENLVATGITTAPTCAQSGADIWSGQVGASGENNDRKVFGGGLGELTNTIGNVIVNVGEINAASAEVTPTIYGDVYGGSALGSVNTSIDDTTTVNFNNGTIYGDVYGGGLGAATLNQYGYLSETLVEAIVYGTVHVNIGDSTQSSNFVNVIGRVFGGNNLAGSPKGNVYVDVYHTAHTTANAYPNPEPEQWTTEFFEDNSHYALNEVYGGGNLAHYTPVNTTDTTARVHVHYCENTIKYVYGGGNAANVPASKVIIDGGLIKYVFGGGNGAGEGNPGANIISNDTLALNGGVMAYVFGGSNTKGMVHGSTDLQFADPPTCPLRLVDELYGGGNQANDDNGIVFNIPCGTKGVKYIYGGSKNANVGTADNPADIELNVRGCDHVDAVYGGNNVGGTIFGNVTLNLYGGTIDEAFGGNNAGGNINGRIQVNMLDMEDEDCPLHVDNVYGGGNMAAYTPTYNPESGTERISPEVNIKHGTVNNAVYGGGKGSAALVTANPIVTIGDNSDPDYKAIVGAMLNNNSGQGLGNVYGGGDAAAVNGNTLVIYQDVHTDSYVNRLFGGGNQASITNGGTTTVNMTNGTVNTGIYGGCNTSGNVNGAIEVNVTGGNVGASGEGNEANIHGGGYGQPTTTDGNVTVTIGDGSSTPINIYGNVYGGSALGSVNSDNVDVTKVWIKRGTVNGRVFGGGLGQKAEGSNPAIAAVVKGGVQVLVDGGTVTRAVYGCNDQHGAPLDTVNVTINGGIVANVLGGGNLAAYTASNGNNSYPKVYIKGGTVTDKVLGGGNAADITGNPIVTISGGTIGTNTSGDHIGVYGGCNESGTIYGTTTVQIIGGTIGNNNLKGYIFGGGFGEATNVTGNVIVNYGINNNVANQYPMLYGELYGGSALGNVNTNASNTTTVNILNGTITSYTVNDTEYKGAVYGGGLGRKAATGVTAVEAKVFGVVHVNIGAPRESASSDPFGKASLVNCDVYGCNNENGSPQDEVHVDVYQTVHTPTDEADYSGNDAGYAIHQVFGGGNEADYTIEKKTYVFIHYCENTIKRMFGGGNAADVWGVDLKFDGGRYESVFGGGNGELGPDHAASIVGGGITVHKGGGYIGSYFDGSNMYGTTTGGITSDAYDGGCGPMITTDYYLGGNQNDIIGDLNLTISCADGSTWKYVNFYGGCRIAQVYGNINVTIEGGTFENVFGGSRGTETTAASIHDYTPQYLQEHPELSVGDGGNITLNIRGGTIGNLFGGCNVNGNIDGKITIIVEADEENCPLFIGNIFGGGNKTGYAPVYTQYLPTNPSALSTPEIKVIKATVGGHSDNLPIINTGDGTDYEGNVFGGGFEGKVTANPKVIIGSTDNKPVTIKGSVYGGGDKGDVDGSPQVIIVPTE